MAAFTDNNGFGMAEMNRAVTSQEKQGVEDVTKAGHTIATATPEEYRLWTEPLLPLQDKWITELEAKCLPARPVLVETKLLLTKYGR